MAGKTITIDVAEFNRVYQAELPVNVERVNKAMEVSHAKMGVMPLAGLSLGDAQSTVCDAWPMIRKLVNTVLKFSWVLKFFGADISEALKFAPQVKAFLTAFDKTVVAAMCGRQSGDPNV